MQFSFFNFLVHLLEVFLVYAPLTGTLRGTTGGVGFLNISARDVNSYLCAFSSVTSGIAGAVFCSA